MNLDFAPLDEAFDLDDYEWMNRNAPNHMAAIERMLAQGATIEQIKERAQRRVHINREPFVKRCEGAARYVMSRRG